VRAERTLRAAAAPVRRGARASREYPHLAALFGVAGLSAGVAAILWLGGIIGEHLTPTQTTAGKAADVNLGELVQRFAPLLVWSADASPELFRPTSAEDVEVHSIVESGNVRLTRRLPAAASANGWQGERAYFCEWLDGTKPTTIGLIPECRRHAQRPPPLVVYARAVESPVIGWYAVEYWFLYFDDYWSRQDPVNVASSDYQTHEGDWEAVTILLNARHQPKTIIYTQHGAGEVRPWKDSRSEFGVEYSDTHPFAYVARGSHASYFSAGTHPIDPQLIDARLANHPALRGEVSAAHLRDYALADPAMACALYDRGLTSASGPPGVSAPGIPGNCQESYAIKIVTQRSPVWIRLSGTWGIDHKIDLPHLGLLAKLLNRRDGPPHGPEFQGSRWNDPWDTAAAWCLHADGRRPKSVQADRLGYSICQLKDTRLPQALWVPPTPPSWWTIGYRVFATCSIAIGLLVV
jgi:hypothetical protein